jgi:uncharacterized membrane protein
VEEHLMDSSHITALLNIRKEPSILERWVYHSNRHWLLIFAIVFGLYTGLPFLAPFLMKFHWETPARAIYFIYSFLCHQLPQRSYFLFGSNLTYSLAKIQAEWLNSADPLVLRQFTGNPELGWKVAWSDRMVAMFTSLWLFGILWRWLRQRFKPLPWWGLVLFLVPLSIDGMSHLISDFAGIGQGFRDSNTWLALITEHAFRADFYAGDAWGSFNSLMRLLSGILFGVGIVWFGFPYMDKIFALQAQLLESRLNFKQQKKAKD